MGLICLANLEMDVEHSKMDDSKMRPLKGLLKDKRGANYNDIVDYFKQQSVEMNEKTIRYHITQLKKAGVLEDGRGTYKFTGFQTDNLAEALEQSYKMKANTAFSNIRSAVDILKKMHEA